MRRTTASTGAGRCTVNGYYKAELVRGPARSGPWKTVNNPNDAPVLTLQVLELLPLRLRQQQAKQLERCDLLLHLLDGRKIARRAVGAHFVRVAHVLTVSASTDTHGML
ncbi:hypothetical protein BOH66_03055 [Microbacterium aurum]|uniref:Uncharacterized protein n=1 Tax=Microbacterium aurum TaxID=36805 RepID=A0A1P8U5I7_9MICO|nr:hypothetical protein BOH66_03055 [Microbacterium aurum]